MENNENIQFLIDEKVALAKKLADKLQRDYSNIDGGIKTKRIIEKEMKFLQKLKTDSNIESVRRKVHCTNLNFFSHLVDTLEDYSRHHNITAISKVQRRNFDDKSIRIDIVAEGVEALWIKVIARNSESLIDGVLGRCEFGSKDILEVAEEYVEMAEDSSLNFFRPPKVIFDFKNQLDENLEKSLEERGIVLSRKYRNSEFLKKDNQQVPCCLNIDVSTMLAYISELSNGGSNYRFGEQLLDEQAAVERKEPIMPILDEILNGKRLIACVTAVKSFEEIVNLLAGPNEKKRAEEFKKRLEIFPDVEHPEEIINLQLSSQIKERSRKIFAFGIFHGAITVSSNTGFKRAAKMRNLDIPMINHSARAMTELKQREIIEL